MAKVCEICGKSTKSGQRKRHHHAAGWLYSAPRSKRTFKPSLRTAKISTGGTVKKTVLCLKCYRTLSKGA